MTALLLQPHSDDCALFACFSAIRYRPHVVTVLQSALQASRGTGITNEQRLEEDDCAFSEIGVTHEALEAWDADPDWEYVEAMLKVIDDDEGGFERVIAPAVLPGGHDQHNRVGQIALDVFGARVTHRYLTYVNGRDRVQGVPVEYEPGWVATKHLALACYRSQIAEPSTSHHFLAPLYEWYAA